MDEEKKEETQPEFSPQQIFEQIHEIAECILKHLFTVPVLIQEGIETRLKEGEAYCIAKSPELWQAVGWLNTAAEHMFQKYEEFAIHTTPTCQDVKAFIEALPTFAVATRMLRRELEKELLRSIVHQDKLENLLAIHLQSVDLAQNVLSTLIP